MATINMKVRPDGTGGFEVVRILPSGGPDRNPPHVGNGGNVIRWTRDASISSEILVIFPRWARTIFVQPSKLVESIPSGGDLTRDIDNNPNPRGIRRYKVYVKSGDDYAEANSEPGIEVP